MYPFAKFTNILDLLKMDLRVELPSGMRVSDSMCMSLCRALIFLSVYKRICSF